MPAQSKAQQRFMGMVHAVQKGDMEAPSKEVDKAADSMSKKDAKDYASTSHKGLPNKKENMNITRQRLKELVKEVMTEESEYQAFFAKALEKAGKGVNAMSDEEKKAFFNKIDTAWNGKGEKSESVSEDIAAELPKAIIPSAVKQKLELAIDKIKDAKLNPTQKFITHYFTPDSPYKGLLLWHSVGTGKTCTGVATATTSFEKQGYSIFLILILGLI